MALVVVEAPAGCGKTHHAADYAHWLATTSDKGQVLILTHTHAACDVFRSRTEAVRSRVHVTTIDGLVAQIGGVYHQSLGLPVDTLVWTRSRPDGFERLAEKVGDLLTASKAVASAIVGRYPVILCDEHQDANAAQHRVVMQLLEMGAKLRAFGDPMQAIYVKGKARKVHDQRWADLCKRANRVEVLDHPHRWKDGSPELGQWILKARRTLQNGQPVDLGGERPAGLNVIVADNAAPRRGGFKLEREEGRLVNRKINGTTSLMILAGHNATVRGVNAYLGRRVPIWEGHTRDALHQLVAVCQAARGNSVAVAHALRGFLQQVVIGFSDTAFANRLLSEVESGCAKRCAGKPAQLQAMARCLLESPNHVGVGRALSLLEKLIASDDAFCTVKIDLSREYHEAARLAAFDDADEGLAEITRRRTAMRSKMPTKFITNVHKAKGLEYRHVLVMPCDRTHFADTDDKRCLLYVALSRAKESLTLVVSPTDPSPLLVGP